MITLINQNGRMTPENFCYWLQGMFELGEIKNLTPKQVAMIKRHLDLVMENVTADPAPVEPVVEDDQCGFTKDELKEISKVLERVDPPRFNFCPGKYC